ncbi:protein BIG GRAIN 1-like B [Arachis duranensis]|uniref:Protein BIG GRAIN 1-like B n=1 Tax=Arachis duranensis TaxID=130453 RepID=A0A6P4C4S6_ARADU|nr:protein BIG GRAIN 1-like B [Arachis duranensis]
MENWDKPLRGHRERNSNPSFSSTLLDAIYRSIEVEETVTTTMKKQKQNSPSRASKVESWMEIKKDEKLLLKGRNSLTEFDRRSNRSCNSRSSSNALSMYSNSTSSESSSAGFSSSESESFYGHRQRPKPIRTSVSEKPTTTFDDNRWISQPQKPKNENNDTNNNNGFGKTKNKALRILYGELKKTKQPISPGARLASFLNSLFHSNGSSKKAKVVSSSPVVVHEQPSSATQHGGGRGISYSNSACSSASSFSRSCLSKTPSSRTGTKRSVRFCPVSVIVGEDCRPCGHKNLHEGQNSNLVVAAKGYNGKNTNDEELRFHVLQESKRVEELARDLLKNYQMKKKKKNEEFHDDVMRYELDYDDDDDDDDDASCCSSDLFELDNLSAIGIERYREELPVYETTHFNTNRAIASGFIL